MQGCLFLYDVDRLVPNELGAVVWNAQEIKAILEVLLKKLGCVKYVPEVGKWKHSSCNGWNSQIERSHLGIANNLQSHRDAAVQATADRIREELTSKLKTVEDLLKTWTDYPPEIGQERSDKISLLHHYYALLRAIGKPQ
jgi:hypothetical protein